MHNVWPLKASHNWQLVAVENPASGGLQANISKFGRSPACISLPQCTRVVYSGSKQMYENQMDSLQICKLQRHPWNQVRSSADQERNEAIQRKYVLAMPIADEF